MDNLFANNHWCTFLISVFTNDWRSDDLADDAPSAVSSAKSHELRLQELGRSLINKRNKIGPRTLPWGTPQRIKSRSDWTPSMEIEYHQDRMSSFWRPNIHQKKELFFGISWYCDYTALKLPFLFVKLFSMVFNNNSIEGAQFWWMVIMFFCQFKYLDYDSQLSAHKIQTACSKIKTWWIGISTFHFFRSNINIF